jgi:hypothetical protein
MAHHEDDLEEELEASGNPGMMARLATITVLILLGIAIYLYLNADRGAKDPDQLPLITENHPPEKVKPDNPGGMDIPNQDASVYDHLDKSALAEPEKLMPSAEAPVNISATVPPTTPANIPDTLPGLPAATPSAPTTTQAAAVTSPAPAEAAPADDLSKIVQQAATEPAASDASARLQLGAVSNQAAADAEWARVKSQHGDELKGLDSHFSQVNLGDKGTFVRIQTDAMSEADAEARCQKLKLENQACMVVKAAQN